MNINIVEIPAKSLDPALLTRFAAIVGPRHALTEPAEIAPYLTEERGLYHGRSPLVLTERNEHLHSLANQLAGRVAHVIVLRGGMGKKQREAITAELAAVSKEKERGNISYPPGGPFYKRSIGKVVLAINAGPFLFSTVMVAAANAFWRNVRKKP